MEDGGRAMRCIAAAIAVLLAGLPGAARADDLFVGAGEARALLGQPHVRFVYADSPAKFATGHIPGSVEAYANRLHLLDDVRTCKGLPMCAPAAATLIGQMLGIDANTRVIVYDDGNGVYASGTWFFLALYGHKQARILDGGLAAWKARGGPLEAGAPARPPARAFAPAVQWEMIATRDEVVKATADPAGYLILDARQSLEEFTGREKLSAYSSPGVEETVKRGGAIPRAIFSPWTRYAGNRDGEPDKPTLKEPAELARQLEKLARSGYDPAKTIITYCHVGLARGSFEYLGLRRAGHKNTKVYIGSWDEWGNDPSLPLAAPP
jgi:thiosulfate/3-mercaptopyruvate sulfurtransferase